MQPRAKTAARKSVPAHAYAFICVGIIVVFSIGCDGGTYIKGVVLDSDAAPIANAEVKLTVGSSTKEVKTSDYGIFAIGMTHSPFNPERRLEITKPGYKPYEKRFHTREYLNTVFVNLEPAPESANPPDKPHTSTTPFSLAVVPSRAGITMAQKNPDEFYIVLTNVSKQPQSVWEDWNSWGYQAISFELVTEDGKKYIISRAPEGFDKNFPSTYTVAPGEHQVFAIRLDKWWETHPSLPKISEIPVTLKAIYEVSPTPEAAQFRVWTGHLESHNYNFTLRQW
jgi:hypothetical protein